MVRPRSNRRAQISMYEREVENPELESALRSREEMKDRLGEARHNFKLKDDAAQAIIASLDLGDGTAIRVGDFVISQKLGKAGHVEFDRQAKLRTRIKRLET